MTEPRPAPYPADTRAKGWRFEVNTEQVKKSDTWLRARTGYVRAHLLLLWSEAWEQTPCGSLPNDDELLALLLDMDAEGFAKHRAVLLRGWWLADDGRLYHEVITERVLAMLEKRAADAKRSAGRRARQAEAESAHAEDTPASHVTHTGEAQETTASSPPSTKHQAPSTEPPAGVAPASPAKPIRRARKPKAEETLLPEGFAISDGVRAWAAKKGYQHLDEHFEAFVDKAKSKGYAYADWDAALKGAIRDDWAHIRSNGRGGPPAPAGESATVRSTAAEQTQAYLQSKVMTPEERESAERARIAAMGAIKLVAGGGR